MQAQAGRDMVADAGMQKETSRHAEAGRQVEAAVRQKQTDGGR